MTNFSKGQTRALRRKLDRSHVQSREVDGRSIDYIEGWFAIAEANAIFGFGGWDRETTHCERLFERTGRDSTSCGYSVRMRIRVRAGDTVVLREGTGWGSATAPHTSEAHERALKAAETDATKRALATFGNRFGLGLYDKEQNGVTPKKPERRRFSLHDPKGKVFAENLSAEAFCGGLRQLIEKSSDLPELEALQCANTEHLKQLRVEAPELRTTKNIHYADVLEHLFQEHRSHWVSSPQHDANSAPETLPLKPSRIAPGARVDKSVLYLGTERRLRDKAHLLFVATNPCLICGRAPTHAHHLTFAQRRGLSMKVSDEFTVPLCSFHHDELHRTGSEEAWWTQLAIEPLTVATDLWAKSHALTPARRLDCGPIPTVERPAAAENVTDLPMKLKEMEPVTPNPNGKDTEHSAPSPA
jgi:DNA recombination protein Rad52